MYTIMCMHFSKFVSKTHQDPGLMCNLLIDEYLKQAYEIANSRYKSSSYVSDLGLDGKN